jgi:NAD(P)-dependent dehydrogenase (short-subunit alcohol dehydrogenase family)
MTMNGMRLAGRVAVVTGAAQGIGEGIARRLAAEGAAVAVADIDGTLAERTAAAICDQAGSEAAVGCRVDVAGPESVAALTKAVAARWGRCDILVNNAGVGDSIGFDALTPEHLHRVIEINMVGALTCAKALVPLMRPGRWGRIVNVASIQGVRGTRDSLAYATAKGGMVNMTRALACELAPDGITVNAVAPGFIDTRMCETPDGGHEHQTDWFKDIYLKYGRIPLGRPGLPDDVAGAAYFLCSDDSRYVTGQILLVDGGVSATF